MGCIRAVNIWPQLLGIEFCPPPPPPHTHTHMYTITYSTPVPLETVQIWECLSLTPTGCSSVVGTLCCWSSESSCCGFDSLLRQGRGLFFSSTESPLEQTRQSLCVQSMHDDYCTGYVKTACSDCSPLDKKRPGGRFIRILTLATPMEDKEDRQQDRQTDRQTETKLLPKVLHQSSSNLPLYMHWNDGTKDRPNHDQDQLSLKPVSNSVLQLSEHFFFFKADLTSLKMKYLLICSACNFTVESNSQSVNDLDTLPWPKKQTEGKGKRRPQPMDSSSDKLVIKWKQLHWVWLPVKTGWGPFFSSSNT